MIWYSFLFVLSFYVLWIFYLAIMSLLRAREAKLLTRPVEIMAYPIFIAGVLIDFLINLIPLTIIFTEWPRQWLVTKRLARHKYAEGYRGRLSRLICSKLLDPFDPSGEHCK